MKFQFPILIAALLLLPQPARAGQVEEVRRGTPDIPALPEDLFRLAPGAWALGSQLWKDNAPCTADECEGGYTSGDLVVSVLRRKTQVRVVAGFRGCVSVSWNDYEIGKKASSGDTKKIAKRIKKSVATSAKYCKVEAPSIAAFDASHLVAIPMQPDGQSIVPPPGN